jgi:hypothetical protein
MESEQSERQDLAVDVSRVQPVAQEIVRATARIFIRHTARWFIGLLAHGSAVKGGYIRGCSDIDLQLYLAEDAFSVHGQLPLEVALAIQGDLAQIDPAPFRYIQCYAEHLARAPGQVGPIPGAYAVLGGRLPIAEATAHELQDAARAALTRLDPYPAYIAKDLLHYGDGRLERTVRYACTDVWPVLYHVLVLQHADAGYVWGLPKPDAISLLPQASSLRQAITIFHAAVVVYYEQEASVEHALAVLRQAVAFLSIARTWWEETHGPLQ